MIKQLSPRATALMRLAKLLAWAESGADDLTNLDVRIDQVWPTLSKQDQRLFGLRAAVIIKEWSP